ncbi:Fe-S cluster assembly transcriptional regulator IscR [Aggregatibacter segnis]|jgi:iron-sulfur cluster assembly transcription factor iscR|uniref:Iron-sulfur cluster assembly transcription regulator IscR n=1 Tax=Aggregatibacter segnis ATCC 33393 TaxID=888057 RepID=E6KWK9_9PAST|nr:Fe-S cluster assembly transcriptional regulator IscR [Aggregatibacter segnis]EFU67890.1 iron-sulfur cluster assembly transcription regulator IscR [Aggregatibacter segnis ATCC 33393]QQB09718.1 Fe-S cluster assembly transcriptional regulator IscR [Aggregatibacter segnis]SQH64523.1 HTH-type transcriptional regulator iscR [Aggregatibacter segnis ATCC 33393]
MKLTSKGRYAVTAILDIAIHADNGPVSLSDISERQHISLSYLEQLFAKLRRNNLVKSVRGPGGGYKLGHMPEDISIGMIIAAVNENIDTTKCLGKGNCQNGQECLTHTLWDKLSQRIADFLNEITLAELVSQHKQKKPSQYKHQDLENLLVIKTNNAQHS